MIKWSLSQRKPLKGIAQAGRSTKKLIERLHTNDIAVIAHDDLDELAAAALKNAKVRAVVNAGQTMTGRIPSNAALLLLDQGIPVFEIDPIYFEWFGEAPRITISPDGIDLPTARIPCTEFTRERWLQKYREARRNETSQLSEFINNTINYAQIEKSFMLEPIVRHPLSHAFAGKHVLVVVRGKGYREDLACLRGYITRARPILLGVDGGADALVEQGYKPDYIVGDMDSVSDRTLQCGAQLIVHAYRNGNAPGLARLERLGLKAEIVAGGGTSEDLALLLAYDHHCEQIVTVGLHSHMHDFLEKGRSGMGSSWLVRMKVGSRLVDARGISRLYPDTGRRQMHRRSPAWNRGARWMARMLRDLRRPTAIQRRESESYGAARIGHHSRLE